MTNYAHPNGACENCSMALAEPEFDALQSPVPTLLDSYAPPSSAECALIRHKVSEIASDLLRLNDEIDQVQRVLEVLCHNRDVLQQFSNSHQNMLHPTRRLPVEILGEILVQWQNMVDGKTIVSAQICRHWRAVAIATSRLWTSIKVPLLRRHTETDVEMTRRWLAHSDGQPLTIELGRVDSDETEDKGHPVFGLLTAHAHRWKSLLLFVSSPMLSFLQNIPEHWPLLHTLDLNGPVHSETSSLPESFTKFSHSPALRVLYLGERVSSLMPTFCWPQLTQCSLLEGGRYTADECYDVLCQCPNLTSFGMTVHAPSITLPRSLIRHSKLKSLEIVMAGGELPFFLDLLLLPALSDIHISETLPLAFPIERLISLISRSSCLLTRLFLGSRSRTTTHDELTQLLNLSPMLSELELEFYSAYSVDSDILNLLTHDPHHGLTESCCLAPKLTAIKLSVHNEFSYEEHVKFLASRRAVTPCTSEDPQVAQLRSAEMWTWSSHVASGESSDYLSAEVYNQFKGLRDDGLDLCIRNEKFDRIEIENYFIFDG